MILEDLIAAVREQQCNAMVKWRLDAAPRVHLAILRDPYLQWLLDGKKTIESRFSVHRCLPHGRVGKGDAILLKRSGGPVVGLFIAGDVGHWECLTCPTDWNIIRGHSEAICADKSFWKARANKAHATLIWVEHLRVVEPIEITKAPGDRRPWIILRDKQQQIGAQP